jgi:propionaldehyde dehydrogenase
MATQKGVFDKVEDAIAAAKEAQQKLVLDFTLEDRDRFIGNIRTLFMKNMDMLTRFELDESGYGRLEDKVAKTTGAVMLSSGTEALPQRMYATDKGLTVEYYAPFGVVGAVTPVTNPIATVAGNGIACVASGNSLVVNAHPAAKGCTAAAIDVINQAITGAGGPENLIVMVKEPSMDTLAVIMESPDIPLLVGTGGPGMVKTLMRSGKKVIAAGAGNPPSIVDETADIDKAAEGIYGSSSFDNNLLCIAEKEIFVVDAIFDKFIAALEKVGAYKLNKEQAEKVSALVLVKSPEGAGYAPNKKCVGKCANVILEAAGIKIDTDPRIAFFEADNDHPLVQTEQMLPIIPIVRCKDFDEAKTRAVFAEHNCKHSASIWSNDINRVTAFGKVINTTIYVQNGGTMAAFGIGGSGTNAPTIATPTGEGVTEPGSFTRRRRFCMAGGGNYLL